MKGKLEFIKIIVPLLVCFLLSLVVVQLYNADYKANVNMMFSQKREMIDIVATSMEDSAIQHSDYETQQAFYREWLVKDVEKIDAQPYTFAAMYDKNLVRLSQPAVVEREASDVVKSIEIENYPEVIEAVSKSSQGVVSASVADSDLVYFYFRWCPTGYGEQFLLITGINSEHIVAGKQTYLYVVVVMIVITVIMNIGVVVRRWR